MAAIAQVMEDVVRLLWGLKANQGPGYEGIKNNPQVIAGMIATSGWCVHMDGNARHVADAIQLGIGRNLFAVNTETGNLVLTSEGTDLGDQLQPKGKAGFR